MLPNQNDVLINALKAYYVQIRAPVTSWGNVMSMHLSLPGLRGFWPMSSADETGRAYDLTSQGRVLTYNGNPTYKAYGLAPYVDLDGTGDYLSRATEAGLNITGTETTIGAGFKGVTLGGWFNFHNAISPTQVLMIKGVGTVAATSYMLTYNSSVVGDPVRFTAFLTPSSSLINSGDTLPNVWNHVVGRFAPSIGVSIFLNGVKYVNNTAIIASMNSVVGDFVIGAASGGGNIFDGYASMCFLSAAAIGDSTIQALYHHTRAMYGV